MPGRRSTVCSTVEGDVEGRQSAPRGGGGHSGQKGSAVQGPNPEALRAVGSVWLEEDGVQWLRRHKMALAKVLILLTGTHIPHTSLG